MKTLIIGAGPLGSLYAYLFYKAGINVSLMARGRHYDYLEKSGLTLINEFTGAHLNEKVNVIDALGPYARYELLIVVVRKNSVQALLPMIARHRRQFRHILFMGNNAAGFDEYLNYLPSEKILFGFPGGGGSRIDHVVHFVDTAKPGGVRLPVTLGEVDGRVYTRTRSIQTLFESAGVPTRVVDDMDSWQKYHVAFVLPLAGALLKSGGNYQLAGDQKTLKEYLLAVREAGIALKSLGYQKSYNPKLKLFNLFPNIILTRILSRVFASKFAEVAMMMHVNAAKDEMRLLTEEFRKILEGSPVPTPHLDEITSVFLSESLEQKENDLWKPPRESKQCAEVPLFVPTQDGT